MFYTVYKITNNINGKFYIGMHQTKNLDDGYMGSGKRLKLAITKYGEENFTKEILFIFDNENDMRLKEKELVVIDEEISYNLCDGGKGGFGYLNRTGLNITGVSKRDYKSISRKVQEAKRGKVYVVSEQTRKKISDKNKISNASRGKKNSEALRGKPKSEEHKRKIAESLKARHAALVIKEARDVANV